LGLIVIKPDMFIWLATDFITVVKTDTKQEKGKMRVYDPTFLRDMLKAANITIEDANLEIGPTGIRVASMDPDHWTMVSLFIPAEVFEVYSVEVPFTVCFNVKEALTILFGKRKRSLKDMDLSLVFKEDVIEAEIRKNNLKTVKTIRLLEPTEEETPEPRIIYKAEAHITLKALKQVIEDCTVSELFTVKADYEGIRFTCKDGEDWLEENYLEKDAEELLRLTVEDTQKAQYKVKHFKEFIKGLRPLTDTVTLEYSEDMPMKLTAWLPWVNAQLVYYTAPRIIEEAQVEEVPVEPQAIEPQEEAPVEEVPVEPLEDQISFYQALENLGFFAYSGEDGDLYRKHGLGGWRVQVYWGTDLAIHKKVHDWAGTRWITGADFDKTHGEDKAKVMEFVERWMKDPSILDERVKDYNPITLADIQATEAPVDEELPECYGTHEIGGHTTCIECPHEDDCERDTPKGILEEPQAIEPHVEEAPVEEALIESKKSYHFYMDPGHGWLKVPLEELEELGIAGDISPYSYMRSGYAYLEEDSDAVKFIEAMKNRGVKVKLEEHTANRESRIRRYDMYETPMFLKAYKAVMTSGTQEELDEFMAVLSRIPLTERDKTRILEYARAKTEQLGTNYGDPQAIEEPQAIEDIEEFDALNLSPEERQALDTMYGNYMIDVFGKEDQLTPEEREQLINQDLAAEIFPEGPPVEQEKVIEELPLNGEVTPLKGDYEARCAAASAAVDEIYRQFAEAS